jgi:Tol biopolymer transport system component
MNRDGTDAAKFIASSGEDSEPAWSPDGKRVLVRSNRSGNHELYSYAADGSGDTQLTRFGGHLGSARWSPDGKWIAFDGRVSASNSGVRHTNIYLVPADGGATRRLTDDSRAFIVPAWSADGRYIYCQSGNPGKTFRVSVDTGQIEEFHPQPLFDMAESEDGRYHYYTYRERASGIYRRLASGGPERLVPSTDVVSLYRYWSTARGGVYFVDGPPNAKLRYWDERTGKAKTIANLAWQLVRGPRGLAVSPDGTKVLFAAEDLSVSDILLLIPQ